ncbi:hypothetical protein [Ruminococcus albus]|uniref:hypothetical protein n=1 Tax=Ruminococcus albus TaxID=1264 RepID=UPI00046312AF|nr:hypothetical protein [Ruminococcus albus]
MNCKKCGKPIENTLFICPDCLEKLNTTNNTITVNKATQNNNSNNLATMIIICLLVFVPIFCLLIGSHNNHSNDTSSRKKNDSLLQFGTLLETNEYTEDGEKIIVIKAKITGSLTNNMTIDQNYFNIEYLIKNHNFNKYDTIVYWAVADMTDGSESKVISFTVDKPLIDKVASGKFPANQMGKYVSDLWILPSLTE